tara:strand:- start:3570 stop:3935 length:366 start_codon:yes stop_codon:yes gene_type:complete
MELLSKMKLHPGKTAIAALALTGLSYVGYKELSNNNSVVINGITLEEAVKYEKPVIVQASNGWKAGLSEAHIRILGNEEHSESILALKNGDQKYVLGVEEIDGAKRYVLDPFNTVKIKYKE